MNFRRKSHKEQVKVYNEVGGCDLAMLSLNQAHNKSLPLKKVPKLKGNHDNV